MRTRQAARTVHTMIDVYGMSSPNVVKITILLEETGLAYRLHHVNVFAGEQHEPQFLAISPNNKVPVIVDDDVAGGKQAVCESGAILIYLAEKTGQLLPRHGAARTEALQWLQKAIEAGFSRSEVRDFPDFDSLQSSPQLRTLLESK